MSEYRKKFLSLWTATLDEKRWHKFESQACSSTCQGWNAWAPVCQCGRNYCRFRPSGKLEDMVLIIETKQLIF